MWFQKKEKELLPDLPDSGLPKLPDFEYPNEDIYKESLSELKNNITSVPETQQLIKQEVIKQEVKSPFEKSFEKPVFTGFGRRIVAEPTEMMEEKRAEEDVEKEFEKFEAPRTIEILEKPKKPTVKKLEPVYVRLDKFKESLELFEDIKDRISEIEDVLGKIKEIKGKEEKELADWEREIQVIKSRLEIIDNTVFKVGQN